MKEGKVAFDFTDELVDMIADQSDAQSGHLSISELLRARDNNLVALLRALKGQDWGAGALLNAQDAGRKGPGLQAMDLNQMIPTGRRAIPLDWTDYNGHMNEARYLQAFCDATDRFMELVGCDAEYIATGGSYFTAETHIRHVDEVHAGQVIDIRTQLLGGEGKKMHLWHEMYEGDRLVATGEHFLLHVDLETRRPSEPAQPIIAAMQAIAEGQAGLPMPDGAGRHVGQRK